MVLGLVPVMELPVRALALELVLVLVTGQARVRVPA
jgi:hypothetical protein